jgi:type IX secretion system PorP/SprF family membrane protein
MRKTILFVCLLFAGQSLFGQQEPQFTHYQFNQLYVNPAMAGSGSVSKFQMIHRSQYAGYSGTFDVGGAPTSQVLTASIPVLDWRSGFGVTLVNDKIGPNTMQDFSLSYALRMPVGEGVFALGARAGLQRRGIDNTKLRYEDEGDPLIPTAGNAQVRPDFGLGLSYSHPLFSFGLSSVHLTQPDFSYYTNAKNTLKRRYYANLSLNLPISYALDLQPMFILKTDLNQYSFEGGLMANINNKVMIGSSYRYQDAISAIVGFNVIKNMKISYAGDFINVGTAAKSPTSHEILLSYTMPAIRIGKTSIIRTPRYRY